MRRSRRRLRPSRREWRQQSDHHLNLSHRKKLCHSDRSSTIRLLMVERSGGTCCLLAAANSLLHWQGCRICCYARTCFALDARHGRRANTRVPNRCTEGTRHDHHLSREPLGRQHRHPTYAGRSRDAHVRDSGEPGKVVGVSDYDSQGQRMGRTKRPSKNDEIHESRFRPSNAGYAFGDHLHRLPRQSDWSVVFWPILRQVYRPIWRCRRKYWKHAGEIQWRPSDMAQAHDSIFIAVTGERRCPASLDRTGEGARPYMVIYD